MMPRTIRLEARRLFAAALFLVLVNVVLIPACAPPPPNLSPTDATAWRQHEVQKDLDLIRDVAIDAEARTPKVLSTDATRKIVQWHRSTIVLVHDTPQGYKAEVLTALDQLRTLLTPSDYAVIEKYVELAKAVVRSLR